ncbi:esterase family protein [Lentibacillus sp. CBA3610]|uniref:alpha/beta hydrolase n=1 Tax=Lentibacillus sp. CBA3610 TaxID=2518176 RepID=UPI00159529C5|nr:alpha/beta hydrolase-fold protein [Lentibacillus sp. CBA3610]QKY71568.1 esterase family protein [Lentibacillus sp. CBA3610]
MRRKGTMTEKQINSHYLNETLTLKIYQPESFSPLYKYQICIMQDGDDYYQLGRAATWSDRLHDNSDISNTILVGIHYRDKVDRRNKYHPDGDQRAAYSKFLVHEVVPFLDDLFPTYHMGQSRALAGDSLAGTLALMTALKYPNTFGKVIMQSPYVNQTVKEAVPEARGIHAIAIYHTIGSYETAVETTDGHTSDFLTPNRELSKLLHDKDMHYIYHELEDASHTWKYWQQDLGRAFISIFDPI